MNYIAQKLHKDREEILDFYDHHERIHLYGAGYVGSLLMRYLMEEKLEVCDVLVSSGHEAEGFLQGVPIKQVGQVEWMNGDGIIVAVGTWFQKQVYDVLIGIGFKEEDIYIQKIYPLKFHKALSKGNLELIVQENEKGYFKKYRALDCLGQKAYTDKCSVYHNYLNKYEFFLKELKNEFIQILELGIFNGNSLKMWEDYFVNAQIYGVDIEEECCKYEKGRCHVIIQDLGDEKLLSRLSHIEPSVIIDDASHYTSHQIKALYHLLPILKPGGIFIVEDLGTNFNAYENWGYQDSVVSCYEFCRAIADIVTSGERLDIEKMRSAYVPLKQEIEFLAKQVEMISFINESCIIVKKYVER